MKDRIYSVLMVFMAIGAMVFSAWYMYELFNQPDPVPQQVSVVATPAPEIKREEKEPVAVRRGTVQAYKPGTKGKLKLPDMVIADSAQVVVASSRIAADERPMTVTAVTNTNTGETTQYVKAEPLPWLAVNTKSEIGIYAGYKLGEPTIRVEGRQEMLQMKVVHLGAIASADVARGAGVDGFVGLGAWVRW